MSIVPVVVRQDSLENNNSKWISLKAYTWKDAEGKSRIWEVVERKTTVNGCDAVDIIPLLNDGNGKLSTLLVLQFRPPTGKLCVEFPAGLLDPKDTPESAALRELKEETGYIGKVRSCSPLLYGDPGMSNSTIKMVVVEVDLNDARNQKPQPMPDDGESIVTRVVPLEDLFTLLHELEKTGIAVDARIYHFAYAYNLKKHI